MPENWGVSPLGNLAQFEVPQFRTGEGLAAILALRQRQAENITENIGDSIAQAMEQRRKDQMTNALLQRQAAKDPLELELLRARIARANRPAATGGGGGGGGSRGGTAATSGFETIWHNGVEYRRSATGKGWVPIKTEGGGAGAGGGRGDTSISESINKGIKKRLGELGTTPEEFGADIQVPGKVTYWTPDYSKQISTEEARLDPKSQAVLPGGGTMSVGDYGKLGQKYRMAGQYEKKTTTATTPPPSVRDVGMGGTESTRVIEKNGHHYEVDDATKSVIRQID